MPAKIEIHNNLSPARKIYAYVDFSDLEATKSHKWFYKITNNIPHPAALIPAKAFETKSTCNKVALGNFLLNTTSENEIKYLDGNRFNCVRDNMIIVNRGSCAMQVIKNKKKS